ncbi:MULTISPECIES: amino acid transport protein [unclassified Acinetobacter]|uniref:amino acid transport protein n=1 Tax=unclassified Acinetobacter TaxID=196816 RepID=UPI001D0E16CE|nr:MULTISPECIES: amino acid transport protein [unclassified Acinetobacter]
MNTTQLLLGLIFSCIGLGYFLYGKKQKVIVPFVCGLVLMIFPYFVENITLLSIMGILLSIIPYFVRL